MGYAAKLPDDLKIARGVSLPIEMVGESTAILAKKGAGKSNAAKVIVEEALDHGGVQVIVLDPIGHWWSLRAGADGKPRGGYPVAVFGGMHGDLPLEPTAGKLLAQTVVESGQSIILDVSSLDSDGAMQRFAYEFAEELYKLKQAKPTPAYLVLEEADEFAPQDTRGPNVPRMVGAFNRIVKRGRGRGIGTLVVTQRSAALNKNVLDQSDTLIVMRTIGPRDRAAIEGWVKHAQATGSEEVLPSLPSLETGEAWIWTPERGLLQRTKIRKARTFDSSRTPKAGEAAVVADVKPIDVEALGTAIKATIERAKENDPAELRKKIRELETLARKGTDVASTGEAALRVMATRAELAEARVREFEQVPPTPTVPQELRDALEASVVAAEGLLNRTRENLAVAERAPVPLPPIPSQPVESPRPTAAPPPPPSGADDGELPTGARHLLATLANHHPLRLTVGQLAMLAKRKPRGGAWNTSMRRLYDGGYLTESGGLLVLTDLGIEIGGANSVPLSASEIRDRWREALPAAARDIFDKLLAVYPNGRDLVAIASELGKQPRGGSWNTAVATLLRNGLAVREGDTLCATEEATGG